MGFILRIAALITLTLAALAPSAAAQVLRTEQMESELVSARAVIAPGEAFTVALRQRAADGWHSYWTNPGDSGEPMTLAWTLPRGFTAGEPQHPAPVRHAVENVMTFIHEGEFFYPVEIRAPASLPLGQTVTLTTHVYYLVCSNICLVEEGDLSLDVQTAAVGRDDPIWAPRIAEARAAIPQSAALEARITVGADGAAVLSVAGAPLAGRVVRDAAFFPIERDVIVHIDPQAPRFGAEGVSFTLKSGFAGPLGETALDGIIAFETQEGGAWARRAFTVSATPGAVLPGTTQNAFADDEAPAAPPPTSADMSALPLQLLLAFIGGLILNFFPCVLPVLAIKGVALAQGAHGGRARRDGLLYLAGVVTTFVLLASLIIALRGAGQSVGWAFQLQEPWLVASLALLFFAIGLNFVGVFEISGGEGLGQSLAARGGDAGAFFTGVLAVVAASPCTGPFMAGALGFALASPPPATLGVFLALALGFAAPLVALSFAPALQRIIPKPGAWMVRFRQVLAFAMFAAAVWLAWVLTVQTGAMGALALMSLFVAAAFLALTLRWGRVWTGAALVLFLAVAAFAWGPLTTPAPNAQAAETDAILPYEAWSVERVAALREEGRPVFVNFTAAWCVQCQVNEGLALRNARVAAAFEAADVAYLKADWTNHNAEIAAELARHQRAGIPLYLFYAPNSDAPRILPQTLNPQLLIDMVSESER